MKVALQRPLVIFLTPAGRPSGSLLLPAGRQSLKCSAQRFASEGGSRSSTLRRVKVSQTKSLKERLMAPAGDTGKATKFVQFDLVVILNAQDIN